MPVYPFPYGRSVQNVSIDLPHVDVYAAHPTYPPVTDATGEIQRCIAESVDGSTFEQFRGIQTAAIAINDKTRPTPLKTIIPVIVGQLREIGVRQENITLLIAVGTHTPATQGEIELLKADLGLSVQIYSHDCDLTEQLVFLGETSRKTPIAMNRRFMEADMRIVTGNIEPHHFMGYSGGVKTASIGLAGRDTIRANHAMLGLSGTEIGVLDENPMRQDIEEIGKAAGIDLALNTILTDDLQIIRAFFGRPENVIQSGVALSQAMCAVDIPCGYDLVIASAGGYPKDINLYQAQKAISHAARFAKPGGIILLAAACSEGPGSAKFEQFMQDIDSPQQVFQKFNQTGFEIGFHKAFQIAKQVSEYRIILVSEMTETLTRHLMLEPADSLQTGFEQIFPALPKDVKIALLPYATHLIARVSPYGC